MTVLDDAIHKLVWGSEADKWSVNLSPEECIAILNILPIEEDSCAAAGTAKGCTPTHPERESLLEELATDEFWSAV